MKRFLLGTILLLIPIMATGDYTDAEVVKLINSEIASHSVTTLGIVSLFLTGLGGCLVWLFYLINENKKIVLDMEDSRQHNHGILMDKIDESYKKISEHEIHVANNYTRDDKIERMLERTVKPMQEQLTTLQHSLNDHFNQRSRQADSNNGG